MDWAELEAVIAALRAEAMEDVADYATRGRRLRHLGDAELADRYLGLARALAARPMDKTIAAEVVDTTSEFALRGALPPFDAARGDVATAVASIVCDIGDIGCGDPATPTGRRTETARKALLLWFPGASERPN